eukprot:TRINITY_DN9738_c0_g1_i1.p1 TRINITY_DN9738_c0_g1~~TRINITY_DN9738_c0_g1_i1.p1  ORF type:complete len:616 (+),score=112.45 TRINITY_DN9738_c0_g1_i1:46-1893(+)
MFGSRFAVGLLSLERCSVGSTSVGLISHCRKLQRLSSPILMSKLSSLLTKRYLHTSVQSLSSVKERFPDYDFLAKYSEQEKETGRVRKPKAPVLPKLTLDQEFHGVRKRGDNIFLDAIDDGDLKRAIFVLKNRLSRSVSLKKSQIDERAVQILLESLARTGNIQEVEGLLPYLPKLVKLDMSFVHVLHSLFKTPGWREKVDKIVHSQAKPTKKSQSISSEQLVTPQPAELPENQEDSLEGIVSEVLDSTATSTKISLASKIINVLQKRDVERALELLRTEASEKVPIGTYHKIMVGCLRASRYEDFDQLVKTFKKRTGSRPTGETNYIRSLRFINVEDYESAAAAIRTNSALLDYEYYAKIIMALCKNDVVSPTTLDISEGLLEDIRQAGKRLNTKVFEAMIYGCISANCSEKILSILKTMVSTFRVNPSEDFYRDLVRELSQRRHWVHVVNIFDFMEAQGNRVPSSILSGLYSEVINANNLSAAVSIVEFASDHGVILRQDSFLSMLQAVVSEGDSSKVEKSLSYMRKHNIQLPTQVATHVYIWSCMPHRIKESLRVLDQMLDLAPQQLSHAMATRLLDSIHQLAKSPLTTAEELQTISSLEPKLSQWVSSSSS